MSTIYSATIIGKKLKGSSGAFTVQFIADDDFNIGDYKRVNNLALTLCMNQNPSKFKTYDTYEVKSVTKIRKIKEKKIEYQKEINEETINTKKQKKSIFRKPYFFIPFRLAFFLIVLPFKILSFFRRADKLNKYADDLFLD